MAKRDQCGIARALGPGFSLLARCPALAVWASPRRDGDSIDAWSLDFPRTKYLVLLLYPKRNRHTQQLNSDN